MSFIFVKIFIGYSSGRVVEYECKDGEKLLVKNIALRRYKAAAAGVVNVPSLMNETVIQIAKKLKVEIRNYTRDPEAVFKYDGEVEKLAQYRNEHLLTEPVDKLPILNTLICHSFANVNKVKFSTNKKALIFSSFLIPWMPSNKFTYRINVLLTTGGCMTEEVDYFHRLGLSSHKNTMRNMQEMLSKNHDKDVKTWKESVENEIKKASLMGEVLIRQEQFNKANNMDVCTIDFSEDTVANLPSYTPQVYRECKEMLPNSDNDLYEDILILQAMDEQKKQCTPSFRLAHWAGLVQQLLKIESIDM